MPAKRKAASPKVSAANLGFETKLWLEALPGDGQDSWSAAVTDKGKWAPHQPQQISATTRRLASMNLHILGIEANIGKEHAYTFPRDLPSDTKPDLIPINEQNL